MLAFCSRPCSHQEFSEKIVKVCLHSSKAVQISLQFNELFEKKFKILTSEIFTINFQKTVLQKVSLPNLSSPNILPRLIALPNSQKNISAFLPKSLGIYVSICHFQTLFCSLWRAIMVWRRRDSEGEKMRKRRIMEGPERVVCCTLCLCMAVAVFSSVALVYLTALVYMPAKREISSGLSDLPVMCTTVQRIDTDDCDWYSCGEWCLSKSSHCTKLWAQVRKNGTDVLFKGCSNIEDITCQVFLILAFSAYFCPI